MNLGKSRYFLFFTPSAAFAYKSRKTSEDPTKSQSRKVTMVKDCLCDLLCITIHQLHDIWWEASFE